MAVPNFLVLCSNLFYFKPPNFLSLRSFFFIPTALALITSLCILFYISSTSNLFINPYQTHVRLSYSRIGASIHQGSSSTQHPEPTSSTPPQTRSNSSILGSFTNSTHHVLGVTDSSILDFPNSVELHKVPHFAKKGNQRAAEFLPKVSDGNYETDDKVYHDRDIFFKNYKEMNKSLRIYVYPHRSDHPFANALLPVDFEPGG